MARHDATTWKLPKGYEGLVGNGNIEIELVTINIAFSLSDDSMNASAHSAYSDLDNCYRDYAQRNASELADLLSGMNPA